MSSNLPKPSHDLSPVKQLAADNLLLVLIVASALTIIITRVFLELTGYPQIGDSTFHIAHVLWGGLLLFIAVAGVLIFANHWALWLAAVLGGIGVGLFIDEVGKFITQSNDYFYPLAFPIIYAFFIASAWLVFRVRRSEPRDTRTLLYHSFEGMKEFLDNDLDPFEYGEVLQALSRVAATAQEPTQRAMALAMLDVVKSRRMRERHDLNWFERALTDLIAFLASWPSRVALRWVLILGFVLLALGAFFKLFSLYSVATTAAPDLRAALASYIVVNGKSQYVVSHPNLLLANSFFILIVGLASIMAGVMFWRDDERRGLRVGVIALVFALTVVDLLTFYFSQLYAMVDAIAQLGLMGLAELYRWRFVINRVDVVPAASEGRDVVAV